MLRVVIEQTAILVPRDVRALLDVAQKIEGVWTGQRDEIMPIEVGRILAYGLAGNRRGASPCGWRRSTWLASMAVETGSEALIIADA